MTHDVVAVEPGSIADQCGICPGDRLIRINGEALMDQIDYQFLTAGEKLVIEIENRQGVTELHLEKDEAEPLGLTLSSSLLSRPHRCANNCVFCFIEQMPKGMRPSLYVRDDDWRLSLMMGNYITLTNLSEPEFQRIIQRRASPLHISVHATDGSIRAHMMGNQKADRILAQLKRLKDSGIRFHCQVVLCEGLNDGAVLDQTLSDLSALYPATLSIALVPVGITACREGLFPVKPFNKKSAEALLEKAREWQQRFLRDFKTRLVFPADEFFCLAESPAPPAESYEQYPQIENGVGLLSRFSEEFSLAYQWIDGSETIPRRVIIATGALAAPYLSRMIQENPIDGVSIQVKPIPNRFFGETVTVAGLVTGQDLLGALKGAQADEILIPSAMVRHEDHVFLDDMPLSAISLGLSIPVHAVETDGAAFLYALQGELFRADHKEK